MTLCLAPISMELQGRECPELVRCRDCAAGGCSTDSHSMTCANCGGCVCVGCGRTHVDQMLTFCEDCPSLPSAEYMAAHDAWARERERELQAEARAHRARMAQLRREGWKPRSR